MEPHAKKTLLALLLWIALAVIYATYLTVPSSHAYLDFGDGNYQYISWRMNQGIQLYTDILSPQPPFHLWMGAGLAYTADLLGVEPLILFRWASLFLRLATSAVVGLSTYLLFGSRTRSLLAAAIFLALPEGYRWSQGYQSEHLEILLLTVGLLCCLKRKAIFKSAGTVFAVGALWTNLSSIPFFLLILLLGVFVETFSFWPLLTAALSLAMLLGLSSWFYGWDYIENVWTNQVASIPSSLEVWFTEIRNQGGSIIDHEGLFILAALGGMGLFLQKRFRFEVEDAPDWSDRSRFLIILYGVASIGSGAYVVKGGTVDYIFVLAEPGVAIFASHLLVSCFSARRRPEFVVLGMREPIESRWRTMMRDGIRGFLISGATVLLLWRPLEFISIIRSQSAPGVDLPDQSAGRIVEFSDREVRTIERIIDHLSEPGDTIWAPPFFAALTKRAIAMDLSETYLWYVKWQQTVFAAEEDSDVDTMITALQKLVETRTMPLLLLNSRTGQLGHLIIPGLSLRLPVKEGGSDVFAVRDLDPRLEKLQSALEREYHPIRRHPGSEDKLYLQGWNERLEIWVPRDQDPILPRWANNGFGSG